MSGSKSLGKLCDFSQTARTRSVQTEELGDEKEALSSEPENVTLTGQVPRLHLIFSDGKERVEANVIRGEVQERIGRTIALRAMADLRKLAEHAGSPNGSLFASRFISQAEAALNRAPDARISHLLFQIRAAMAATVWMDIEADQWTSAAEIIASFVNEKRSNKERALFRAARELDGAGFPRTPV